MLTGAHLIARALKAEGIDTVFTLAGDHILPALDVMADMGFRFVDTRHEQAAVHMADAWGRVTGRPGVYMVTTPGHANAIPGLAHAMAAASPVISISGSAEMLNYERGIMQEIDQVGMARPVTKGAWLVHDARRIPDFIARAFRVALEGRRGPVHLTIPIDVQEQKVDAGDVRFFSPGETRAAGGGAPPDAVRAAIALLRRAERPVVIAGAPAAYTDEAAQALLRFAAVTRLPLFTEEVARGAVPDDHPACFGFFEQGLNKAARLLRETDVVVPLGKKQDYTIRYAGPPAVAADARIIQVDPSPGEIGKNRGVAVGIAADIPVVLAQLADAAAGAPWRELPWHSRLRAEREAQAAWYEGLAKAESPMHAAFVHRTVQRFLRPDDILAFDGGDFCHWGRALYGAHRPRSWLHLPTLGMLGSAIPTAMAAKLAHPGRRVFAFTGDGSFGFHGMEYDTAVRHGLHFVTILGNDAAWGIDRHIQVALYGKPVATDLLPSRYDRVVEGLGGHGEHVERPEELAPALERALASGRPALLNVRVQNAISPRGEAAIGRRKAGHA